MTPEPINPQGEEEAYRALLQRVGRRGRNLPADSLVRHVMAVVPAEEWPVRVEATEAILRRNDAVKKDALKIGERPKAGRVLGSYRTRRGTRGERPYRTALVGLDPIAARCDCPDFLKNSLAICKHALTILDHVHSRPRLVKQAVGEEEEAEAFAPELAWNPIRPLTGEGDWLARVVASPTLESAGRRASAAASWLQAAPDGTFAPRSAFADDPAQRLAMVEDFLRASRADVKQERSDPALDSLLATEQARLKQHLKLSVAASEVQAMLEGMKRRLYPYQLEGVTQFLSGGKLLLADDMGLGKTAQAITSCDILWRSKRVRRGLIIAPASLKPQWAREWANFSDVPITVIDGTPPERQAIYESSKTGLFIINYEQLIRDLEVIRRWSPDLVVLDEAQRMKNWATKTAMSVKRLEPAYRLVLTGTPMENRIDELASIVEWVDDRAMEPKWRLNPLHAIHADGRKEVVGVRHLDTIRTRLKPVMVRRVRQDVLSQLPPRTDTRVPIEWTEEQKAEHDSLIQPIAQLVQKARSRPLSQPEFLRLMSLLTTQRIISNGLAQLNFASVWPAIENLPATDATLRTLDAPKLGELRQIVQQIAVEQGRKLVVFSQWRRMLALARWAVKDLMAEHGFRAGFFTGAEGQKRRTQNIVEFHDDPSFRILFASDAGGVGLNLQHAANCVVNLELPWNPAVLEQRIGRVHRLGQTDPIDVFNLVCEEGIESRISSLVGSKQAMFKGLFDGDSDSVQFEQSGSFLSRVEKIYEESEAESSEDGDGEVVQEIDDIEPDVDSDPFEEMLETADEASDASAPPVEAAVKADGGSEPTPAPFPATGQVRDLFAQLRIRREGSGKVVIEAPPEAAETLGALFEGMAAMLRNASTPIEGEASEPTS